MPKTVVPIVLMVSLTAALGTLRSVGVPVRHINQDAENWKVQFRAFNRPRSSGMPVEVLAFDIVNHQGGMWVRQWRLKNRSAKTVVKIRPALFVTKQEAPDVVLVRREVRRSVGLTLAPNTDWPKSVCLPQMKSCEAAFATFSLEELMQPLREQRKENESYSVSLAIDKVWFEDGTTWEFDKD